MGKAKIEVEVAANFAKVTNQLQSIHKSFNNFASGIKNTFLGVGAAITAGLSVAALTQFTRNLMEQADHLNKISQSTGIAVGTLSKLGAVAQLSGVDINQLAKGVKGLSTQMLDAAQGLETSARNFRALGVNIKDQNGNLKDTINIFEEVAGKFNQMQDGTTKTALAVKLFGRAGMDLIPMLNQSKEQIQGIIEYLGRWGSISKETTQITEEVKDKIEMLSIGFKFMATEIMGAALPAVMQIVDALLNFKKAAGDNQSIGESLGRWIKALAMTFIELAAAVELSYKSMLAWGKGIKNIFSALFTSKTLPEASEQFNKDLEGIKKDFEGYKKLLSDLVKPPAPFTGSTPRTNIFTPKIVDDKALKASQAKIKKEIQEQIAYEKQFKQEMMSLVEAGTPALEKLEHQEMKLNNAVANGIITQKDYEKALSGVRKQLDAIAFAQKESALALKMTEIETKASAGEITSLETAKEKVGLLEKQLALHKERLTTMAKGTAEEITAWNQEAEAMNQVSQALNEQIDIIKRYTSVWYGIKQGLLSYYEEATKISDQIEETVTNAFRNMEDALVKFVRTGKLSFKSLVDSILEDLARLAVRQFTGALAGALMSGLSGMFGGGGGGGTESGVWVHKGGLIGDSSLPTKMVPQGTFSGAPRLHKGLMSDEYPAILQRGETVLPRGYGGSTSQPNIDIQIINQSKSEVSIKETSQSDGMSKIIFLVKDIVSKDISGGGVIHNSLRSTFGAAPKVLGR